MPANRVPLPAAPRSTDELLVVLIQATWDLHDALEPKPVEVSYVQEPAPAKKPDPEPEADPVQEPAKPKAAPTTEPAKPRKRAARRTT